jgi:NAD(P)-dependent dehydrogenase (short-subunit alcohol dehydrogenase family)
MISKVEERHALASHVESHLPDLDVLINNAGIQRRVSLASDTVAWPERQAEIDILLSAPVHLNHLLIPLILRSNEPGMIVNVTSGAAFVPQVFAPLYSASKAALHNYTELHSPVLGPHTARRSTSSAMPCSNGCSAAIPTSSGSMQPTRLSFGRCSKSPSRF